MQTIHYPREQMHRIAYTKRTERQIADKLAADESGKDAPTARHSLTNRAEGKGFYWRQDTGVETLDLYPSTFCVLASSFVKIDGVWKIERTEWIS